MFTGIVERYRDKLQLTHPDAKFFGDDIDEGADALEEAAKPIPIYAASAKAPSWRIQKTIATVLSSVSEDELGEPLPDDVRERHRLLGVLEALRGIHQPRSMSEVERAQHRFRFEEAFVLQAALARRR